MSLFPDPKLGNDFLRIPKLQSDGKNWIVYADRLALAVRVRGLEGHLTGKTIIPVPPADRIPEPPVAANATSAEVTARDQAEASSKAAHQLLVDAYEKEFATWSHEEAIVAQQIASTVPESLYLRIRAQPSVKQAMDIMRATYQLRSRMFVVDLCRKNPGTQMQGGRRYTRSFRQAASSTRGVSVFRFEYNRG